MGEAWSPPTEPANIAATQMTSRLAACSVGRLTKTEIAIGIKMPNVPQLVPVAKANAIDTIKKITGKNIASDACSWTTPPT